MKSDASPIRALKATALLLIAAAASDARAAVSFETFNLASNAGNQGMGIRYNPDTFALYNSGEQTGAVMGRSGYDTMFERFFSQSYINGDYNGGVNQAKVSAFPVEAGGTIDGSTTWSSRIFINQGLSDTYYGIRFDHGGGNYSYGWLNVATPGNSLVFVSAAVQQAFGAPIEAGSITGSPIPEPGSAALWAGVASGFVLAARRRRRAPALGAESPCL